MPYVSIIGINMKYVTLQVTCQLKYDVPIRGADIGLHPAHNKAPNLFLQEVGVLLSREIISYYDCR